jgi:hypothetical protein
MKKDDKKSKVKKTKAEIAPACDSCWDDLSCYDRGYDCCCC